MPIGYVVLRDALRQCLTVSVEPVKVNRSNRGLWSGLCCSATSLPNPWYFCIYMDSQVFISLPFFAVLY